MKLANGAKFLPVFVLPLLILCLGIIYSKVMGPFYVNSIDPEYAYLLNSLNITEGNPPEHIDHPGTSVQLLGALVLKMTYQFQCPSDCRDLTTSVLRNSEFYLLKINQFFQVLIAGAFVLFGYVIFSTTKSWKLALTSQAFLFFTSVPALYIFRVSAEPIMIAIGLVLAAFLVQLTERPSKKIWIDALILGMLVGIAFATKLIFLPFLLLGFLWGEVKYFFVFILGFLVSLRWITEPIRGHYYAFFDWFFRLFTRSGHYGTGEVGIPAVQQLEERAVGYIIRYPHFFMVLAFFIFFAVGMAKKEKFRWRFLSSGERLLLLICMTVLCNLLMVIKHPADRYLLPSLVVFSVLIPWFLNLSAQIKFFKIFSLLACIGFLISVIDFNKFFFDRRFAVQEQSKYENEINKLKTCRTVNYGHSKQIQSALLFGNGFAGSRYSEKLGLLEPQFLYWHEVEKRFLTHVRHLNAKELLELKNSECVNLIGTKKKEWAEKSIYENSTDGIYDFSVLRDKF